MFMFINICYMTKKIYCIHCIYSINTLNHAGLGAVCPIRYLTRLLNRCSIYCRFLLYIYKEIQ
jgi:hypothetical protein